MSDHHQRCFAPAFLKRLTELRHDLHRNPELGFCEHRTAAQVADLMLECGLEVHSGIGGTGIVAVLSTGDSSSAIGLRADMDALPMTGARGRTYDSTAEGAFHGCGHDGHTTMLVGAAMLLAQSRDFNGTVYFIFQPAEEGLGGARAMVQDGLFERFRCDRIFALHNWPELPIGTISLRPGAMMAAADKFEIILKGPGGHAAMPHNTPDTLLAASHLVTQLNSIVSRFVSATDSAVLSVTQIDGGSTHNVMPSRVRVQGTVRTFALSVQERIERALRDMCESIVLSFGVGVTVKYDRYYPATMNDPDAANEAARAAATVANFVVAPRPTFGSEDFAFMLERCKGAYIWLGQADEDHMCPLHHPDYDFNDRVITIGINLFLSLVQEVMGPADRTASSIQRPFDP